ncbi:MAG: gamma-glutamyltransferase, partial [Rhizomicrobium sp.]
MRRLLSTLTSLSFLLTPTLSIAQPAANSPSGNSQVSEFNGAKVAPKAPPPIEAEHGMAVSSQRDASKAGADILAAGGNAIDAAVAIGYALAVTHPCCGNIGGGGFATIHLANGKDTFINFREKAPAAASANMYLDAKGDVIPGLSLRGYKAVGVPGSVMGFQKMLDEYGTMKREQVMTAAIKLADQGYVLQEGDVRTYGFATEAFAKEPNVAAVFLNNGQPWKVGETLMQKNLAATLKQVSAQGPDVFYKGDIAQRVVDASKANGGLLTMQDFADYTVTESAPLYC